MSAMEQCANCERVIGKLETAHLHGDQVVCEQCKKQLESSAPIPPQTLIGSFLEGFRSKKSKQPPKKLSAKQGTLLGILVAVVVVPILYLIGTAGYKHGSIGSPTAHNYEQIQPQMSQEQVHKLLGLPSNSSLNQAGDDIVEIWITGGGHTITIDYLRGFGDVERVLNKHIED